MKFTKGERLLLRILVGAIALLLCALEYQRHYYENASSYNHVDYRLFGVVSIGDFAGLITAIATVAAIFWAMRSFAAYINAERGSVNIESASARRIETEKGEKGWEVWYAFSNAGPGTAIVMAYGLKAWRQEGTLPIPIPSMKGLTNHEISFIMKGGDEAGNEFENHLFRSCPITDWNTWEDYRTLGETHRVFFQGYVLYRTLGKTFRRWFTMEGRAHQMLRVFRPIGGGEYNYEDEINGSPWEVIPPEPKDAWKDKYTPPPLPPVSFRKRPPNPSPPDGEQPP